MRKATAKPVFKHCEHPGCEVDGEYRAPKSRQHVEEGKPSDRYYHFCLEHVREYNKHWDYFSQMSLAEIEQFQRDAIVGHRKTKPISGSPRSRFFAQQDAWFFGFHTDFKPPEPPKPKLKNTHRQALAALNMDYPFTEKELKTRYRALAKKFHPDTNSGNKKAEESFKEITTAYRLLMTIL